MDSKVTKSKTKSGTLYNATKWRLNLYVLKLHTLSAQRSTSRHAPSAFVSLQVG